MPQHPPPHCILQDANLGSETEPTGGAVLGLHRDCLATGEGVEVVGGGGRKEELRVLLGVWVPWETQGWSKEVRGAGRLSWDFGQGTTVDKLLPTLGPVFSCVK